LLREEIKNLTGEVVDVLETYRVTWPVDGHDVDAEAPGVNLVAVPHDSRFPRE
jgi:hypothetical protein